MGSYFDHVNFRYLFLLLLFYCCIKWVRNDLFVFHLVDIEGVTIHLVCMEVTEIIDFLEILGFAIRCITAYEVLLRNNYLCTI